MKFLKSKLNHSLVNMLVMMACVYTANTRCCWIFHQPEMPEDVKLFKKF